MTSPTAAPSIALKVDGFMIPEPLTALATGESRVSRTHRPFVPHHAHRPCVRRECMVDHRAGLSARNSVAYIASTGRRKIEVDVGQIMAARPRRHAQALVQYSDIGMLIDIVCY